MPPWRTPFLTIVEIVTKGTAGGTISNVFNRVILRSKPKNVNDEACVYTNGHVISVINPVTCNIVQHCQKSFQERKRYPSALNRKKS
jgi:hypothetical protein